MTAKYSFVFLGKNAKVGFYSEKRRKFSFLFIIIMHPLMLHSEFFTFSVNVVVIFFYFRISKIAFTFLEKEFCYNGDFFLNNLGGF